MNDFLRKVKHFLYEEFAPVTKALALGSAACYLLFILLSGVGLPLGQWLILEPREVMTRPWTLLTYPLVELQIISAVLGLLWLWLAGSSLERSLRSTRYAWLVLTVILSGGLTMALAGLAVREASMPLFGWMLPMNGITWAWALRNPRQEVHLFGILPLRAEWLAWLLALYLFLSYFGYHWLCGIATLGPIPAAYLFCGNPGGFSFKAWREARRKKRLRVVH
jgi:membrane associated rhomboid family serine protease